MHCGLKNSQDTLWVGKTTSRTNMKKKVFVKLLWNYPVNSCWYCATATNGLRSIFELQIFIIASITLELKCRLLSSTYQKCWAPLSTLWIEQIVTNYGLQPRESNEGSSIFIWWFSLLGNFPIYLPCVLLKKKITMVRRNRLDSSKWNA